MEVITDINILLNLGTAGLVAYTARTLKNLRTDLAQAAGELHGDLRRTRREAAERG